MKKLFTLLVTSAALLTLASCMEKEETPPHFVHVESVSFGKEVLTISETKTHQLTILFTPEDSGNKKISWYNTDPTVATVSADGLITAKAEGVTEIGIETSDMRRKAKVVVTVTPFLADVPITSITLSTYSKAFQVTDGALTVTSTITPENASIPTLEWITSDAGVATVGPDGVITPVGHGRATITAKANDGSKQKAECKVTVNGILDRNYASGDPYYKLIYYPVNIEVTLPDGSTAKQTWLDRNLGATKVAASKDDYPAYGSLFQWSRKADGHEKTAWTSGVAGAMLNGITGAAERVSDRANAGHNKFIPVPTAPNDWAQQSSTDADGLWGGAYTKNDLHAALDATSQANNPCPSGYRVPTVDEFLAMGGAVLGTTMKFNTKFTIADPNTVFAESPLHLPSSGDMLFSSATAATENGNLRGVYWANASAAKSGENYNNANRFLFMGGQVIANPYQRANGYSVRCIRDMALETTSLAD